MEQTATGIPYRPLRTSPIELRLVLIHPNTFSSPMECSLKYVYLKDKPEFEALSYVWGDTGRKMPIWIHGNKFLVTENLEQALRHLRLDDTVRTFWIDAICINQSDMSERAQQVQHMRDFYGTARRTLVWLGQDSENIRLAFEHILEEAKVVHLTKALVALGNIDDRILEHFRTTLSSLGKRPNAEFSAFPVSQRDENSEDIACLMMERDRYKQIVDVLQAMLNETQQELRRGGSCHVRASCIASPFHDQEMDNICNFIATRSHSPEFVMPNSQERTSPARTHGSPTTLSAKNRDTIQSSESVLEKAEEGICDILERPWWERVWVVQEIGMSQDVIFQCGGVAATWTEFYEFFVHKSTELAGGSYPSVLNILSMRKYNNEVIRDFRPKSLELVELLQRFRYCQSTDPLDKVYALLGLAEDFNIEEFIINYSLTPKQLYTKLTKLIIERDNSLSIFGYIICAEEELAGLCQIDLPSWVPDWSAPASCQPFENTRVLKDSTKHFYTACGSTSVSLTTSSNPDELIVKGFIHDFVADICEPAGDILALITGTELYKPLQHMSKIHQWENKALWISSDEDPYNPDCRRIEAFWRTIIADTIGDSRATKEVERMFDVWSGRAIAPEDDVYYIEAYVNAVDKASSGRRFGLSHKKFMFLGPADTQHGDLICVLLGSQTPVIIRETAGYYRLIGACYVHGIMDGESMKEQHKGKYKLQDFVLR